jgi:diguanylate cyclase (GGDEF)-like protein
VNPPQPRPTGLQAASCWSAVRRWLSRSRRPPDDPRAGAPSDLPADPCFSALFGQVADGLLLCRADGQVLAGNPAAATLFDRDAAGLAGVRLHDLLHQGSAACADPASVLDGDASAQRVSGVRRVEVRARPIDAAPGRPWLLHLRDTAERAQAQERLTYLANFDRLTGLPNRALFRDRLAQAMARARRSGRPMALLVIDLDRFKIVNDSLGHDVGDRLLQHVTRKLSACLREVDSVARAVDDFSTTLSRLGGDEFTVIAEGVQAAEDAASIARRLLDALATPFHAGGEEIVISGSIGISLYPTDDVDLDGLLRHTDMAMYRSKSLGRGMYSFFSDDLNAAVSARLSLEGHLRRAVEREEFTLHYQPKADLGTGRVTGVEALLRWHRPGHGLVPPDRFISVLEDTGLILPVGAWVIRTACRQLADWDRQGLPPLRMAVNLSARQFRHLYLASLVADSLRENAIDPTPARDRADRVAADGRHRGHAQLAGRLFAHGRAAGHRRLRHRPLVAELPAPLQGGHAEDRPLVRADPARQLRGHRDCQRRHRAGPQHGHERGRRRGGDAGSGRLAGRAGLQRDPGLPAGSADAARRLRRVDAAAPAPRTQPAGALRPPRPGPADGAGVDRRTGLKEGPPRIRRMIDVPVESRLLQGLNEEQLAAVTLPAEPALILAGAGSGKTRVLTTRIAWLLSTGQVSPGGVLAVTFTNKAAKEMLTRLSAMLPIAVRGMWIGTFHGLCNRFLRAHWKLAGLPQGFQILDSGDQLSAVKRVIKAMNLDEERFVPKQVTWFIAGAKEEGQRPRDVEARDAHGRKLVEVYQAYEAQCQREGVVDFAELMLRTYELLRDNDRAARALPAALSPRAGRRVPGHQQAAVRVAEDVCPAGIRPGCVRRRRRRPEHLRLSRRAGRQHGRLRARVPRAAVIKLEQNYRSYGHILDAANELIAHNSQRLGKNLRTDAGAGEPVRVFEATSDFAEAQWLLDEAQQLHRSGVPRSEIALLYRSNAQSRVIESALFNAGVPYRVYGGLRFFERAEVKHALAYLRLIENPNDDTSFLRVVNFPARGIGARTVEQLQDAARAAAAA